MNDPKPEHRITAVEKRTTRIEGLIEEMSADTAESLNALQQDLTINVEVLRGDIEKLQAHVDLGFLQARDLMMQELGELKQDITSIKSTQEQILKLLQQKSGEKPE